MPSARRRRFNVHNEIANRQKPKIQNETQIGHLDTDLETRYVQNLRENYNKNIKNKMNPSTSKRSSIQDFNSKLPCKSSTSMETVLEANVRNDKEVMASSSSIDFFTMLNNTDLIIIPKENVRRNDLQNNEKLVLNKEDKQNDCRTERNSRRDKRTHRIKVRSPKRKGPVINKHICKNRTVGIDAVNCCVDLDIEETKEIEVQIPNLVTNVAENAEEERVSSHSLEDMCRICHSGESVNTELGRLVSACSCRGTVGRVHVKCLERWLTESGKSRCELCGTEYVTKRVHKFGVLRALGIWILSNNSRHMFVDFLGIMIMTPIAVVAAGLTGRTFAGLMAQDQMTPWPLASSFVLACMTLVCYYCWIVSALTRHALGWWLWYRSHYEVRLQLQEDGSQSQDSIPSIYTNILE